jgi:cell wall-associated NlpC family hydrolase
MRRGQRQSATLTVVGCMLALVGLSGTAAADPIGDAKAQARQLQTHVSELTVRAEQATEKFNATESDLAQLVVQQVQASKTATTARAAADNDRAAADSRTRALYMSGGTLGLYASVLTGGDPGQLLAALHSVQSVSEADSHALLAVNSSAHNAQDADVEIAALRNRQDDLTAAAASASADVEDALAQQQQALTNANAEVLALEAQLQAQLDADNAARATQAMALAQQAAIAGGLLLGNPSSLALTAIAAARTQIGKPYVYGGSGPDSWDCSGLTQWAFGQAGVQLPRTAAQQYAAVGTKVPLGLLQAGDLLFWATDTADPSTIHHVAIYLGGDWMVAAPHTGVDVQIEPVYLDGYIGAVRIG